MNRKLMALNVVLGVVVIGLVAGCPFLTPATDLCAGVACDAGFTCNADTGKCEAVDLCADVTCDEGSECNADTGTCETVDPCTGVECADGQVCDNGQCVTEDPCAGVECAEGDVCDEGQCIPGGECAGVQCVEGEECVEGQCFPSGSGEGDIEAGQAFFNEKGCTVCHGDDASGGIGPNLQGVSAAEVFAHLSGAVEHTGGTVEGVTQQDADNVAAWLGSL